MDDDEKFMTLAIEAARKGIGKGQTPFGACIVKDGEVVTTAHNAVWMITDITAHAEMQAIRRACVELGSIDLSGCTVYSTTEPCTMCFSAIHWAKVDKIIFGTMIKDAMEFGFYELHIPNEEMKVLADSHVQIVESFMREECIELLKEWKAGEGGKKLY